MMFTMASNDGQRRCLLTVYYSRKACNGLSLRLFAKDGKVLKLVRCQYFLGIVKTYMYHRP